AARERGRELRGDVLRLEIEAAGRGAGGLAFERNAFGNARARLSIRRDELVQEPAHLPRVARDFAHAFLVVVELLERQQRQVDVMFLGPEEAPRAARQNSSGAEAQ